MKSSSSEVIKYINFKINLHSKKTKNLKKKQIVSICKLKNSFWPWTLKKQLEWFKKNTKKNDLNNMLIINDKLVGYTLLRKRNAYLNKKLLIYYYFDAFVIHRKFRNKGLGKVLILFNNKIIDKQKKHSFLTCSIKNIPFYLKYNWKILPKNQFKIMDHKPYWFKKNKKTLNGMTYSFDKKFKKKILYYLND